MSKQSDILVVAPHPDDIEFGAAGTIARLIQEGKQAVYALCTSGDKGTSDRSITPGQLAAIREQEQQAAAQVIGVREVVFLRYPDQGLEDSPAFRKDIVRLIRRFRPETVMTCDPYRRYVYHRDHRIAGRVVLDAVFPFARDYHAYPELIQEGLEPHKVKELLFWGSEDINYRCDITAAFDLKLKALHCHESQVRELGIENLAQWLRSRCSEMAKGEPFELAEAFHRALLPP
jgi:LmbE family N-acetylglucosaminyl deacetylase